VKGFSENVKVIDAEEAKKIQVADPGLITGPRPQKSPRAQLKDNLIEQSLPNSVFREGNLKDSPVKETIGNEDESEKVEKLPKKKDSFDYNEDDLPTVGADIKMGKVVPQFTEIKVKSKLDHSQPTRVDKADAEGTDGQNDHADNSESDFGDLEFADLSD